MDAIPVAVERAIIIMYGYESGAPRRTVLNVIQSEEVTYNG